MSREGTNPLKGKTVGKQPAVVACVITHLPELTGYHNNRMQVIQTSLTSLRNNSAMKIPVMVWDNGSCDVFRDWLIKSFKPEYLVLSPNVGKTSARSAIPRMFPLGVIVAIADDDMLYYPNWLMPQLDLLKTFPDVGCVSGYPVRTQQRWGNEYTLAWAKENAKLEVGRFIPDKWDEDFCTSIGRDYKGFHIKYTEKDRDYLITYKGRKAYAAAHHCQFLAYAGRIAEFTQWTDEALSAEMIFDKTVDGAKLLRLTTTDRLTRHMGNVLDSELKAECRRMGVLYGR